MQVTANLVLNACSSDDIAFILPHLSPIALPAGKTLARTGQPIEDVCFLRSGIAAVVAGPDSSTQASVGLFGRDGFSGGDLVLGASASSLTTRMQTPGEGYRMAGGAFLDLIERRPSIRAACSPFLLAQAAQFAETALFNAKRNIESRLARWLMLCHDLGEGHEIALSHDSLASMLGVRRASVTEALHVLEGEQAVHSTRLRVSVRDRGRLEAIAAARHRPRVGPRTAPVQMDGRSNGPQV